MKLNFKRKKIRYPCACCGYKTLLSNELGEICPICFWEEDYHDSSALFEFSATNNITLYQAQDNYKKHGYCKYESAAFCRPSKKNEKKDKEWLSIQNGTERNTNITNALNEINKLSELLKQLDAEAKFTNFKRLDEVCIMKVAGFRCDEFNNNVNISNQLFIKSLAIVIAKKNSNILLQIFVDYYNKGINYYIPWLIILSVLLELEPFELTDELMNILVDIENNDFFGLTRLESLLRDFWKENSK